MTDLQMTVGPFKFQATYADAPKTVAAFRARLLGSHEMVHVGWSGEAGWIPLGDMEMGIGAENTTTYPAPGQLILHPNGVSQSELLLSLGAVSFASRAGALVGNHFATITNNLADLPKLDRLLQLGGKQPILFEEP